MKMVLQVVENATLSVEDKIVSHIDKGLVVFFCACKGDDEKTLEFFAKKIATLRIFEDGNGKTNLSVKDVGGQVLIVSQFTLAGDFMHGNRPSCFEAEEPKRAQELYNKLCKLVRAYEIDVKTGVFGEDMKIVQTNAGPFTAFLEK